MSNQKFESSIYNDIKRECDLDGTYLIRIRNGVSFLYSSLKAVKK